MVSSTLPSTTVDPVATMISIRGQKTNIVKSETEETVSEVIKMSNLKPVAGIACQRELTES